jgi:hypothetical protein
MAGIILWSLKLRFWASRNDKHPGSRPDIRIFAVFYDPATTRQVEHSIGLKEGLIGVANVFAVNHMTEENNVIVVHELLHTLGATDKYDPSTTQPLFPVGYADPEQSPLYPQKLAEIMAGRVPLSETESGTTSILFSHRGHRDHRGKQKGNNLIRMQRVRQCWQVSLLVSRPSLYTLLLRG